VLRENVDSPIKNKAAYSRIILLIKKRVFTCIMAIYDKKDSVNTGKTKNTGGYT